MRGRVTFKPACVVLHFRWALSISRQANKPRYDASDRKLWNPSVMSITRI